jgi:hypothetical protein
MPWSGNQINDNPLFNNKLTAGFLLGDGLGDDIFYSLQLAICKNNSLF